MESPRRRASVGDNTPPVNQLDRIVTTLLNSRHQLKQVCELALTEEATQNFNCQNFSQTMPYETVTWCSLNNHLVQF